MATFKDLNLSKPLLNALNLIGFDNPTPIQEKAYPIIMSGVDAVGISQTGTGKTFAYLLPILRLLTYSNQRHPRVLIILPTRELVVQVVSEIDKLTKFMNVRCLGIYGASNINIQKQKVYDGLDILVATPGRLMDLTASRTLQFSAIKKIVIDEVDEMLNLGFRPQLLRIIELLPVKRQNILFSATINEDVEAMIEKYFVKPIYIEHLSRGTPLEKINQGVYFISNFYTKVNVLKWLLKTEKEFNKVLLFVKNKKIADDLEKELSEFVDEIGIIHSNKSQSNRFNTVTEFQNGKFRLLIASDLIARGIDIFNITHVINFDFPKDVSSYLHRIGRTGRADKIGVALSFVLPKEKLILEAVELMMNKKINLIKFPKGVITSDQIYLDEMPVTRDKNLNKTKKIVMPKGAFHEKKDKNKKLQLGGKRRQEKQRRALAKSIQMRKF